MSELLALTIKETAEQTGISEDTIRYYEKIGLLPPAERKENKHRIYRPDDIATMKLIACLKKTGMSLEEMKPFLNLSYDDEIRNFPELFAMMQTHRSKIVNQIESLQEIVDFIDSKMQKQTEIEEPCTLKGENKLISAIKTK
ncbi:MerR family transcriptional regulator [Paenibacillus paridis]|uniref:MerR family transcriptional regulator n=1 Tax=Paenibacillus paridis TaxID=2583376 RepID=UPI001EE4498F|nr:MerR family transcriptional regulator [Paenibacillus paridis]